MPIHGPRKKDESRGVTTQKATENVLEFESMIKDWLKNQRPHRTKFHFPDYSCCIPVLRARTKDKVAFYHALKYVNEKELGRLQKKFEEAARKTYQLQRSKNEEKERNNHHPETKKDVSLASQKEA